MRNVVLAAIAALALTGCETYTADLTYVRASGLGYRNAALYTPGYLFLWDTQTNTLSQLANDITLEKAPTNENPTTLTSSSVSGVSISGNFGVATQQVAAEASLGQKVGFVAENAVREKYRGTYTGLANAYAERRARGENVYERWYVEEVTAEGTPLRYVLVTDLVRASRSEVTVGGKSGSQIGKIEVSVPGLGAIDVGLDRGSVVECSGEAAPCFFEAMVLKADIANDGNLSFRVDAAADKTELSAAFRGA